MNNVRGLEDIVKTGPRPKSLAHANCEYCKARLISICAALESDELLALDQLARRTCFRPRETLFQEHDAVNVFFNITSGMVRLVKVLPDGRRTLVGFAMTGDFLGLSMADRHVYSGEALTDVSVCEFRRDGFSDLVDQYPRLLRRLHAFTGHELTIAQEQMAILGRRTAVEKVVIFLLTMRDRWSRVNGSNLLVILPMSRMDIADYLGLTVETISRTLTQLVKQNLVVIVPNGVRLVDISRLEAIAAI